MTRSLAGLEDQREFGGTYNPNATRALTPADPMGPNLTEFLRKDSVGDKQ